MTHIHKYFAHGLFGKGYTDQEKPNPLYYVTGFSKNIVSLYMFLGVAGFIATLALSGVLGFQDDYADDVYYRVVFGTTIAAGLTTGIDFSIADTNPITPITIGLGSIATFISVAMWSRDVESDTKLALLVVQLCSNAIMMGVIFNQNRENLKR